ncbi:MAG: chromosome segregation protein SMC [Defluviitaleaceae bacterium]|nr:chromosome segregation protein SMC [Defluviitaleaceae bacterium]
MHLKKLELAGFKSFAERTRLDFAPGLNAVVGPNGSGKSNIADALRWVLGEQSAKQLRGGKMEDIIFAGTTHRKPLGYAEIVMRLDNSDNRLPLDFNEIAVTRRVYRSGESEYQINGESCRLKDIQHLFMDTGVGRDGYSIIGQGRIDEILSLKSEDRRHVFEDAAGISKFKARRGEALNKLERERQNRARTDDIIAELEEQLEPLAAQSEEARRYLELRDEYKSIHINIFLEEINRIGHELKQTDEALNTGLLHSSDGKRLLAEARVAGEELKNRTTAADVKYRRANEVLLEASTAIEQCRSKVKVLDTRAAQLETDIKRLRAEADKRGILIASKSEEATSETLIISSTQKKLENLNALLNEQLEISAKREDVMREGAAALDTLNQAVMDAMNAATDGRAAVLAAEGFYTRLEDDKERLNAEIFRHENKLEEEKTAIATGEATLKSWENEIAAARKNLDEYIAVYTKLREETDELEKNLRQTSETLTASRGSYRGLSELEDRREGYYRSVKAVLSRRKTDPRFSGICGAVGELIGVEREFETAIEIALGGAAQNIITKTEDDAKYAIDFLKQSKEGRATFLPLTAVRGKNIDTSRIQNEPGFISIAASLAESDAVYKQVIAQLLGDIVIMDNLENALALHKKFKYSYKIVTKSGERLSPGGAITGGSLKQQSAGIIGRANRLETMKSEIENLQWEFENLSEKKRVLDRKRAAAREASNEVRERLGTLQLEEQAGRNKIKQSEENMQTLTRQTAYYNEENASLMERLVAANGAIRTAKAELASREEAADKALANLETYRQEVEQNRQKNTEEADTVTELRVEITHETDKITHAQLNTNRLQRETATLTEEQRLILAEITANEAAITKTGEERAVTEAEAEKMQMRAEEARLQLNESEAEKAVLDAERARAEADERTQIDAATLLEREIARLEARKENLDATSHRLHNEIWEEYGLTFQAAQGFKRTDLSDSSLRKKGRELKDELLSMTDVNIGAIEAYKQIKERHGFLTTQRDDILGAEAALDELIESLTAQMEQQFAERFMVIAAHFQDVFKEMFDGGKASLRLLDDKNVLESGIEIIAQPPGKSLQNLMLLSGGERALTAIALLFAILRMKPSPFCVLDEIESALDDANVSRFANFLRQYAKGTQFIIITHRKGTMEAADNLYGVTMEEQGISKLVSVKFTDTA